MNKNFKSNPLLIIVAIAIVFFIISIFMNQFQIDNSEPIVSDDINIVEDLNPKATKIIEAIETTSTTTFLDQKSDINDFYPPGSNTQIAPSKKQRKEKRVILERKLNMSLMLDTPEKIVDAINALQKQGKEQIANEYIEYLLTTFPDYTYE